MGARSADTATTEQLEGGLALPEEAEEDPAAPVPDARPGGPNPMVVGSVAALAATPAAEVRALALDLCETMPPEALNVFLVRVARALPPPVHRALVARFGGNLLGSFGSGAVNRFLSRRLAKKAVLFWLDRTPANEVRDVVKVACEVLPDQTINSVLPIAMAFVDSAQNQTRANLTAMSARGAASSVTTVPRASPAVVATRHVAELNSTSQRADTRLLPLEPPKLSQLQPHADDAGALAEDLEQPTSWWRAFVGRVIHWSNQDESEGSSSGDGGSGSASTGNALPSTGQLRTAVAALSEAQADALLRQALSNLVHDLEPAPLSELRSTLGALLGTLGDGAAIELVPHLPMWAKLRLLEDEEVAVFEWSPEPVIDGALLLTNQPRPIALRALPKTAQETHELISAVLAGEASSDSSGDLTDSQRNNTQLGVGMLGPAVGQLVEQLPPSFIAEQAAELVANIPPDVVHQEALNLLEALPPAALSDLADRLAEALPSDALRSLATQIVGEAPPVRKSFPGREIFSRRKSAPAATTPSGIPADTAAVAREVVRHCEDGLLRRSAKELLGRIPPAALKERLKRVVIRVGPEGLQRRILEALQSFQRRTVRFASFRDMQLVGSASKQQPDKSEQQQQRAVERFAGSRGGERNGAAANVSNSAAVGKRPEGGIMAGVRKAVSRLTVRRRVRVLTTFVTQLPADLLATKVLETLVQLPPECYASLAQDLSKAGWSLLVRRTRERPAASVLATGVSSSAGVLGAVVGTKTSLVTKGGLLTASIKGSAGPAAVAAAKVGVPFLAKAAALSTALFTGAKLAAEGQDVDLAPLTEAILLVFIVAGSAGIVLLSEGEANSTDSGLSRVGQSTRSLFGDGQPTARLMLIGLVQQSPAARRVLSCELHKAGLFDTEAF